MISGLIGSSNSLGAFAGPVIAGTLNSKYGFAWSITASAFLAIVLVSQIECLLV